MSPLEAHLREFPRYALHDALLRGVSTLTSMSRIYRDYCEDVWDVIFEVAYPASPLAFLSSEKGSEDVEDDLSFQHFCAKTAVEFLCQKIVGF